MTKKEKVIIQKVAREIKRRFEKQETAHDWFHMQRVWRAARYIGKQEKANMFVVELAALFHDMQTLNFITAIIRSDLVKRSNY